jgi:cysteine desulfurase/selenocysteine lyase
MSWRDDFPVFKKTENHRLAFLDSAASSQKPRSVIDAVSRYYEDSNANVHRGVYELAVKATEAYESSRVKVAEFVNAPDKNAVIFTRGTTESVNLVASSWGRQNIKAGDVVVVTALEHHSNLVPWQMLCQEKGASIRMVEILADGTLDLEDYDRALELSPKLVAISHVSNAIGTVNPIARLVLSARKVGAVTFVDGAQAAPHFSLDLTKLDADFYAFSGHKMLAPMGIGVLVGRPSILEEMPPFHGGGEMIKVVGDTSSTYAPIPAKFEAGTPNVGGAVGLAAAIDYLTKVGMDTVDAHERELAKLAMESLRELGGVKIFGPEEDRSGLVSFWVEGVHPHDLATILDENGVAVRAGHHCAQPLMRRLGVSATARASFYLYNDAEDVAALVDGVRKAQEIFSVLT